MTAIIKDWTNEQHHACTAVGSTMLRKFIESPRVYYELYVARSYMQEQTDSMSLGTAFHTAVLEPHLFAEEYVVIPEGMKAGSDYEPKHYKKDGTLRADAPKLFDTKGKIGIPFKEMQKLDAMCKAVYRHPIASEWLNASGQREKTVLWDHESGVTCKARLDLQLDAGPTVDIKTSSNPTPGEFRYSARKYGYLTQECLYRLGRYAGYGIWDEPFYFLVVGSSWPFEVFCYELNRWEMEEEMDRVHQTLNLIAMCEKTNDWEDPAANTITVLEGVL